MKDEPTDDGTETWGDSASADASNSRTDASQSGTAPDDGPVERTRDGTDAGDAYCPNCGASVRAGKGVCGNCGETLQSDDGDSDPTGRYLAAFVGAVVSFFLGWIPLVGPPIGGGVAGYLRGSDTRESALTGVLANVLASIPMLGLAFLFMLFGGVGVLSTGDGEAALGMVIWGLIFAGSFLYFFVLGGLGGALGASLSSRRAP